MDTIIKTISVIANYNELIFESSMSGFYYLYVSRRSFQRIDFRFTDSYGKAINLKHSHKSLSLIFSGNKTAHHVLLLVYTLYRITTIL